MCFRYNTATTFYFCELHIIVIDLDKKSFIFLPTILLDNLEILIKQQYASLDCQFLIAPLVFSIVYVVSFNIIISLYNVVI